MINIRISRLLNSLTEYKNAVIFELNEAKYPDGSQNRSLYYHVNNWCQRKFDCSYEDVLLASPSRIFELLNMISEDDHIENQYVNALEEIYTKFAASSKGIGDYLPNQRFTGVDYVKVFGEEFSCPYCNLQTLTLSGYLNESEEYDEICNEGRTSQLDHFFVKSKYPIFCLSIYNLIPVCSTCNSKKGEENFLQNPFRRREISNDATFRHEYLTNIDEPSIKAEFLNDLKFQSEELGLAVRYSSRKKLAKKIEKNLKDVFSKNGQRLIHEWGEDDFILELENRLGYEHDKTKFWEYEYSKLYYDLIEEELDRRVRNT